MGVVGYGLGGFTWRGGGFWGEGSRLGGWNKNVENRGKNLKTRILKLVKGGVKKRISCVTEELLHDRRFKTKVQMW